MASLSLQEEIRAALSLGTAIHLPSTPYDKPHAATCNNPEFHIDRTHTAGGVFEQTKQLYQNIYIDTTTTQYKLQNILISIHVGTLVNAWLVEENTTCASCSGR